MESDKYDIEWLIDTDEDLSDEDKRQLVNELKNEIDVEGEIEYNGEIKRRSAEFVLDSILITVTALDTFVTIIQILRDREDEQVGIRRVNNEMVYVSDEINPTTIEENNGTIIEEIDGDVYFTQPDGIDDQIELNKDINLEKEEE